MEKKQKLEIDIELKDLIMEFFRCWKLIVCCALVGGILLGAVSYVNSYKAVNTPAPPVVESAPAPTGQEIIDALTIDELPDVVAAVELKAQIDDKTAYLKDSILMKIDPFQVNRVSLEYLISAENVLSVMDSFENLLANTTFSDNAYENELVSVVYEDGADVIHVEIIHVDEKQCANLAELVKNEWNTHANNLISKGVLQQCQLVSESQSVVVDEELHRHQDAYLKECVDDQDTLAKMRVDMNANQISAYFHMWNAMYGEVEETTNDAVEETNTVVQEAEKQKASVSMKQVLLGMILGAVLAVVYVFAAYIMTGKLRTANEVEKLFGVKLLTVLKGGKEEIKLAATSVYIQCQEYGADTVYVSGTKMAEVPSAVMEELTAELKTLGVKVVHGEDLTKDAEALLQASKTGNALLLEKKRSSAYKDILKSVQMCTNNHIRVLGMIVVE